MSTTPNQMSASELAFHAAVEPARAAGLDVLTNTRTIFENEHRVDFEMELVVDNGIVLRFQADCPRHRHAETIDQIYTDMRSRIIVSGVWTLQEMAGIANDLSAKKRALMIESSNEINGYGEQVKIASTNGPKAFLPEKPDRTLQRAILNCQIEQFWQDSIQNSEQWIDFLFEHVSMYLSDGFAYPMHEIHQKETWDDLTKDGCRIWLKTGGYIKIEDGDSFLIQMPIDFPYTIYTDVLEINRWFVENRLNGAQKEVTEM